MSCSTGGPTPRRASSSDCKAGASRGAHCPGQHRRCGSGPAGRSSCCGHYISIFAPFAHTPSQGQPQSAGPQRYVTHQTCVPWARGAVTTAATVSSDRITAWKPRDPGRYLHIIATVTRPLKLADRPIGRAIRRSPTLGPATRVVEAGPPRQLPPPADHVARSKHNAGKSWDMLRLAAGHECDPVSLHHPEPPGRRLLQALPLRRSSFDVQGRHRSQLIAKPQQSLAISARSPGIAGEGPEEPHRAGFGGAPIRPCRPGWPCLPAGPPVRSAPRCPPGPRPPVAGRGRLLPTLLQVQQWPPKCLRHSPALSTLAAHARDPWPNAC